MLSIIWPLVNFMVLNIHIMVEDVTLSMPVFRFGASGDYQESYGDLTPIWKKIKCSQNLHVFQHP